MNNDQPIPLLAITVSADTERHQVLVVLGEQTLALTPEAAHALATALSHAATALCPIATERPKAFAYGAGENMKPADPDRDSLVAADLVINTIAVLVDRYRKGTLQPAPRTLPRIRPVEVNIQDGASLSTPKD